MQPSELDRRVSQNRHDIEEIYVKIDQTNETVARIAAVQQEHGAKLDSHSAILADHTTKLDSHSAILAEHSVKLDCLTTTVNDHSTKLDEILRILRGRRGDV